MYPQVTLPDRQYTREDQAKQDDHHTEYPSDHLAIFRKHPAGRTGDDTGDDKDHRESQHEERRTGEHPTAAGGSLDNLGGSQTRRVGEVAGQQRHYAR
jgi:hypothetical protein